MQELEEAFLMARLKGNNVEARFWNQELIYLLLDVLDDSGNSETTSGPDSGEQ
jgi:hypothetical protein